MDEVQAAIRAQGIGDMSELAAVVLETDGSVSVIRHWRSGDDSLSGLFDHGPTKQSP